MSSLATDISCLCEIFFFFMFVCLSAVADFVLNMFPQRSKELVIRSNCNNILIVGWKLYSNNFGRLKNQSFSNNSGKPHPVETKFDVDAQVKGQRRSGNFGCDHTSGGKTWGLDDSGRAIFLSGIPGPTLSTTGLHHIWSWHVNSCPWYTRSYSLNYRSSPYLVMTCQFMSLQRFLKGIFQIFPFRGHLPPKNITKLMCLIQTSVRLSGRPAERYFPTSVCFLQRTISELLGIKCSKNFAS